jgi:hypothetical protein
MWTRSRRSSPESGRRAAIVLVAVAAPLLAGVAPADSTLHGDEAPRLARRILTEPEYQIDLPPTLGTDKGWDLGWLAPLARLSTLLIVALAAGLVLLLVVGLTRAFVDRARGAIGARMGFGPEPGEAAEYGVPDPERLAEQGDYRQAIHSLLLLAIRDVARRGEVTPARSWTSRELSRRLPLRAAPRRAFERLVGAVEISYFGGAEIGPDDYRTCVELYRAATGEAGV